MAKRAIKGTVRGVAKEAVEKYIAPAPKTITYTKQVTPAPVPRYGPAPKEVAITKQAPVQIAPTITPPPTPRIVQATGGYQPITTPGIVEQSKRPFSGIQPGGWAITGGMVGQRKEPWVGGLQPEIGAGRGYGYQGTALQVAERNAYFNSLLGKAPYGRTPGFEMTPGEQAKAGSRYTGMSSYEAEMLRLHPSGGYGTPTELRAGYGYDAGSAVWGEAPGWTEFKGAQFGADTAVTMLNMNIKPSFLTPFTIWDKGITPEQLTAWGYVQQPSGNWHLMEFWGGGEGGGEGGGGGGGGGGYGGYGGYGGGSYGAQQARTMGLIMWRIGL